MKEQLAALYALQQQDSTLDALKRQFALLDSGVAEKKIYEDADIARKAATAALNAASGDLKDAELEQQQVETKRKEYETKLYGGKVHNPKELQAIQDEVDMLGRLRVKLDDKIIMLSEAVEDRKKELSQASAALKLAKATYTAKYAQYKITAEEIRSQAQEIVNQRSTFVQAVTPPMLKRYEAMRLTKSGLALAALEDGNACGGCKMALPSSLVIRVHEGSGIEYCQNCGRMLCEGNPKPSIAYAGKK